MTESFEKLFIEKEYSAIKSIRGFIETDAPLVIVGSGNLGRKIGEFLVRNKRNVVGFADNNTDKSGSKILGLKVDKPANFSPEFKEKAAWIIAIWSPGNSFHATFKQLEELGVKNIFHALVLMQLFPNELLPHFHFQTPDYFNKHKDELREAYNNLSDEESKKQFLAHIDCRINSSFKGLPPADTLNQYFPSDIITLSGNEVFLDCGAYTGDTLLDFNNRTAGRFKNYLALEPDPGNFEKLEEVKLSLKNPNIQTFPYAAGSENQILKFDATGWGNAGLSEGGSIEVECKKLDDYFYSYKPTYLKFDIEGAELDALKGAEEIISNFKPKLAVCIYHLPDDLWTILIYLKNKYPFYKFHARTHQNDGLDFVLYAIPH